MSLPVSRWRTVCALTLVVGLILSVAAVATPAARQVLADGAASVQPLPYGVVDAEYSTALDRIVIVAKQPNQLHIYNPQTNTSQSIDLPRAPLNVSVSPDGRFAAVGHDALISYVDLERAALVKTLDLSAISGDIVLAGNGRVYVAPQRDQWTALYAVAIATNTQTLASGFFYAGNRIKLHAGGQSIYSADNGLSPSDIAKFDISVEPAVRVGDSPYHGDYAMCGNLWPSKDGLRLFTACGNVFRTSAVASQDMTYNGSLSAAGLTAISSLDHALNTGLIFALKPSESSWYNPGPSLQDMSVTVANYNNLTLVRQVALPSFPLNGQQYGAHGRYVFVNAAETLFYTLVQGDGAAAETFGVVSNPVVVSPATPTATLASSPTGTLTPTLTPTITPTLTPTATATAAATTPPANSSELALLPYRVIDAEYSRPLDRIVMIAEQPNRLLIYDPETRTTRSVALPRVPLNVSVGPDVRFAAVGHDALVSYVDLERAVLVKTLDVSAIVGDIVLAGNGRVYVSPQRDQWTNLYGISIASNTQTAGAGIRADTRIKLHPGGRKIYGANRGLSPDDIEKYDISVEPSVGLGDSPYHGDYYMGGDLWLAEDGLRVFAASGNVFRSSTVAGQDLLYNGSLGTGVRSLTHSAAADRIFVVGTGDDSRVQIFTYQHLQFERSKALPAFQAGGLSYGSHGRFVFVNAAGTKIYTVVQADLSSGLLYDYGVVTSTTDADPVPPTATWTLTPTASVTPSATPSPTIRPYATPVPSPTLTVVPPPPTDGPPGSSFVFTELDLPAGATATLSLWGPNDTGYRTIASLRVPSDGRLYLLFATASTDPIGLYRIRLVITLPAQTQLASSEIVRDQTFRLTAGGTIVPPPPSAPTVKLTPRGFPIYLPALQNTGR